MANPSFFAFVFGFGAALLWPLTVPGQDKAKSDEKPALGIPDYTKVSRSLANSMLPTMQPEVLWTFGADVMPQPDGALKMVSLTRPTVAEGVVYFGDDNGRLMALKANDSAVVWQHEHGSRIAAEPSVDQEHVYFGSKSGVTAIRRDNGRFVWRHAIEHGAEGITPIPVADRVFISGYDGASYGLKHTTGEVLWKHDFVKDAPPDQPEFDGKRARFQEIVARPGGAACDGKTFIQCVFDQSRVIALDCKTGERRWTYQAKGWLSCAPTIANGRVFISSQDANLYCLNCETGALIWNYKTPGWFSTSVAVHEGQVFITHHHGRLYQLDADTGRLLKTFQPMDEIEAKSLHGGPPLIANGTAYYATAKGQLYAFDLESGEMRWKLRPSVDSELSGGLDSDRRQIFVCSRQDLKHAGDCAIIAIGMKD